MDHIVSQDFTHLVHPLLDKDVLVFLMIHYEAKFSVRPPASHALEVYEIELSHVSCGACRVEFS